MEMKNENESVSENENESHDKSVQQIQHPFHKEHPLVLVAEQSNEGLKAYCDGCGELLSAPCFTCFHCNYHLHKQCAEAPLEIPNHRLHPKHSYAGFFLRQKPCLYDDLVYGCALCKEKRNIDSDYLCNLCQKQHFGPFYGCSLCHFNINVECAWPRSTIEDKSRHQHPFTILRRQDSFICDACGTEGNYISYICSTCSLMVHKDCTSLPLIIKFSRHDHCIFHKYFLKGLTRQDCKICFKEVRLDRGSYSCGKLGCNYVVHVNCVLEEEWLYEVIEEEKQCEELEKKSMQSSIIRVIEVNEAGEAIKIQHLSHQHCLVLANNMEEDIDRKCDGCMLPISNIFYYCLECPFFLHKTCVELPRIKQHWFHQSNSTLYFDSFKKCDFCNQRCSGFFYKIGEGWDMCLRCAKVSDIIECKGHQHFLFFDFKYMEKCNGCGETNRYGAFRCGKCRFALDFGCLTLPHSALHKIDEHKLKLTYHDDNEQSYCDICEKYRDPSLWHYSCSICDTSAHIKCVLGHFPFLKDGVTFIYYHKHHHDLKFFRKVKGYPECSYCGKLCQEEILKCEKSTCNYIIHNKYKCRWRY
ncbi:hypothetical protein E1A91_D06G215400v1 [Gossypium mustelinum]|uniref:Phorbol-ester/DAG-type domain-containing protein n=1 Tax=Gossypium mustelinum TaxID=34275 RepID=A0A5D2UL95_GOSMU|nr:hypothetical protein E1A91_D06G215400v1 [Gossypium mustelinum]